MKSVACFTSISGASAQPREDGGLLPNDILQSQDIFRRQAADQRQDHRESAGLPHLRGPQHADQHIALRPAGPGRVSRLLPIKSALRLPAAELHVHVLPRLPDQQARRGHRLRSTRAGGQVQEGRGGGVAREREQQPPELSASPDILEQRS